MLMPSPSTSALPEPEGRLGAAQAGDEAAFARLVEPYRRELHAHCYRMLGSVYDADDAMQETLLRAWRGLSRFEGRSALRSWLYTIATNACLTQIRRRPKRVLPIDYGPAADPHTPPGQPVVETVWIEPYPDEMVGLEDGYASPEARYEQREGIELAFVAALQHLAPNQRAVLILREVLGFSAKETADMLETTVASANSALQRARAAVEERIGDQTQQTALRAIGDEELKQLVDRYVDAWERNDVDTFAAMLAEDATFAMPPLATWYETREGIRIWAANSSMSGAWRWKARLTRANGQPALAFYAYDDDAAAYLPFALNVLSFRGREIIDVTAFINRSIESADPDSYLNFPGQPYDARRLAGTFERFGLPDRLEDD
jgi:RNA polymerase sigma-70 factor (ECF subfamily)